MRPAHTIQLVPWRGTSTGERIALEMTSMALWPLQDETFIHSAENTTDVNRIILFCDVERPMKYGFMTAINRWVSHHIVKASATQNMEGEDVGVWYSASSTKSTPTWSTGRPS